VAAHDPCFSLVCAGRQRAFAFCFGSFYPFSAPSSPFPAFFRPPVLVISSAPSPGPAQPWGRRFLASPFSACRFSCSWVWLAGVLSGSLFVSLVGAYFPGRALAAFPRHCRAFCLRFPPPLFAFPFHLRFRFLLASPSAASLWLLVAALPAVAPVLCTSLFRFFGHGWLVRLVLFHPCSFPVARLPLPLLRLSFP